MTNRFSLGELSPFLQDDDSDGYRLAEFLQAKKGQIGQQRRHLFAIDHKNVNFNVELEKLRNTPETISSNLNPNLRLQCSSKNPHEKSCVEEVIPGATLAAKPSASSPMRPPHSPPHVPLSPSRRRTLTRSGGPPMSDKLRRATLSRLTKLSSGRRTLLTEFEQSLTSPNFEPPFCSTPLPDLGTLGVASAPQACSDTFMASPRKQAVAKSVSTSRQSLKDQPETNVDKIPEQQVSVNRSPNATITQHTISIHVVETQERTLTADKECVQDTIVIPETQALQSTLNEGRISVPNSPQNDKSAATRSFRIRINKNELMQLNRSLQMSAKADGDNSAAKRQSSLVEANEDILQHASMHNGTNSNIKDHSSVHESAVRGSDTSQKELPKEHSIERRSQNRSLRSQKRASEKEQSNAGINNSVCAHNVRHTEHGKESNEGESSFKENCPEQANDLSLKINSNRTGNCAPLHQSSSGMAVENVEVSKQYASHQHSVCGKETADVSEQHKSPSRLNMSARKDPAQSDDERLRVAVEENIMPHSHHEQEDIADKNNEQAQSMLHIVGVDADEDIEFNMISLDSSRHSRSPLDLIVSRKASHGKKQLSAVHKSNALETEIVCGLPVAHAIVHRKPMGRPRKNAIPLNKPPGTPVNGEPFANQMKEQLARLTKYDTLDLRKRKSHHEMAIPQCNLSASDANATQCRLKRKKQKSALEEYANEYHSSSRDPSQSPELGATVIQQQIRQGADVAQIEAAPEQEVVQTNVRTMMEYTETPKRHPLNSESQTISEIGSELGRAWEPDVILEYGASHLSVGSGSARVSTSLTSIVLPAPEEFQTMTRTSPPHDEVSTLSAACQLEQLDNERVTDRISFVDPAKKSRGTRGRTTQLEQEINLKESYLNVGKGIGRKKSSSPKKRILYSIDSQLEDESPSVNRTLQTRRSKQADLISPPSEFASARRSMRRASRSMQSALHTDKASDSNVMTRSAASKSMDFTTATSESDAAARQVVDRNPINKQDASVTGAGTLLSSSVAVNSIPNRVANDDDVFKKPQPVKKTRGRKQKTSLQLNESQMSEDSEANSTALRRSKRGHVPLKNTWSFTSTDPTPLYAILMRRILEKQNHKNKEKDKEKRTNESKKTTSKKQPTPSTSVRKRKPKEAQSNGNGNSEVVERNIPSPLNTSWDLANDIESVSPSYEQPKQDTVTSESHTKAKTKTKTKTKAKVQVDSGAPPKKAKNKRKQAASTERPLLHAAPLREINSLFDKLKSGNGSKGSTSPEPSVVQQAASSAPVAVTQSYEQFRLRKLRVRVKRLRLSEMPATTRCRERVEAASSNSVEQTAPSMSSSGSNGTRNESELVTWLKNVSELPSLPDSHKLFQFMNPQSASELVFVERDGVDYAFYETDVSSSMGYLRFKPHQARAPKRSKRHTLHYIVLSGVFKVMARSEETLSRHGDLITIPKGVLYQIENCSDDIGLLLFISGS